MNEREAASSASHRRHDRRRPARTDRTTTCARTIRLPWSSSPRTRPRGSPSASPARRSPTRCWCSIRAAATAPRRSPRGRRARRRHRLAGLRPAGGARLRDGHERLGALARRRRARPARRCRPRSSPRSRAAPATATACRAGRSSAAGSCTTAAGAPTARCASAGAPSPASRDDFLHAHMTVDGPRRRSRREPRPPQLSRRPRRAREARPLLERQRPRHAGARAHGEPGEGDRARAVRVRSHVSAEARDSSTVGTD